MKLEFLGRFFKKCSNIKFHENPSSRSRVFPCGHTDEANSRFSKFFERAYKLYILPTERVNVFAVNSEPTAIISVFPFPDWSL
jgi:hypothetical protein